MINSKPLEFRSHCSCLNDQMRILVEEASQLLLLVPYLDLSSLVRIDHWALPFGYSGSSHHSKVFSRVFPGTSSDQSKKYPADSSFANK